MTYNVLIGMLNLLIQSVKAQVQSEWNKCKKTPV